MIWKTRRNRRSTKSTASDARRRSPRAQPLERRELFAADPIHVGVVYLETDYLESDNDVGSDSQGDRFLLSFTGGAPGTELERLVIRTDKDGDGISVGDPIFDTQVGGRGKSGAHDFQLIRIETTDGRVANANAQVTDGGQVLVLELNDFRAGDRLEFTLDVDEVLRNSLDLEVFNDRLDVITSGQEFQDSILEAVFGAPHFESTTADAIFLNDYGSPAETYGLSLPPDEGSGIDSRPNRSAAAVGTTVQTPKPIGISGYVWLDNNLDRVWQSGEMPLTGVELSLLAEDTNGQYVDTGHRVQTAGDGAYQFPKSLGLGPGTYRVAQTQPDGLFSVAAVPGTVAGTAAGVATNVNVLSSIEIPLGDTEAIEMNFAEAAPAALSGYVYRDGNDNGLRESGETGVAGVTVQLVPIETLAAQDTVLMTTDSQGRYSFDGLSPGAYEVIQVSQPMDLVDGIDTAGTIDGQTVGIADDPGDAIRQIQLHGGSVGIEYNFGELELGEISGFVYLAAPGEDCTGIHDPDLDEPLGGVIVELQRPDGNVISRVTTTPMGEYRFEDVPPGVYRIVQFTPSELLDGNAHVGTIDGVASGLVAGGSLIRQITMTPGGVGVEYNFCEAAPAAISGYVYHDASDDGVKDNGEDGLSAVTIDLVDSSGAIVATTLTGADGRYEFADVIPGDYELRQRQPDGYLDGIDSLGTVDGRPSGSAANDRFSQIELPQGLVGRDYNFGELLPAQLSGLVHVDLDGDCIRDPREDALQGVTIRLLNSAGNEVASTTTNADGIYRFVGLRPGAYTVVQDQPAGFFDGGVTAGSAGGTTGVNRISDIELGSGVDATDYDFCEEPPATLAGSVHVDADGDCIRDPDEQGIEAVTIELRDAAGNRVATTTTDAQGHYQFVGLRGGDYSVFEVQPQGYFQGGQVLGSAGGVVLGVDLMSVSLQPGQTAVDYLFCEYEPGSISGSVWSDADQDQRHDADEDPISEVDIKLVDENGNVIRTAKTDIHGRYSFNDLPRGVFRIGQDQPGNFFHGGQLIGSLGGRTIDDDLIGEIRIQSGEVGIDYDFPEVPPAMISGFVFIDGEAILSPAPIPADQVGLFKDGIFTPDDTPIEGVLIEIRDAAGQALSADAFLTGDAIAGSVVTTDAEGAYSFQGLRPGTYTLFQTQPDGLEDSIDTAGTTGGLAVNAGDFYTRDELDLIVSIQGTETNDALLAVAVSGGEASELNNFSEIIVEILEPPVLPPPVIEPPVVTPPQTLDFLPQADRDPPATPQPLIETFEATEKAFNAAIPRRIAVPMPIGEVELVTWHLSVINGGYPRGQLAARGTFRTVGMKQVDQSWPDGDYDRGEWKLMTMSGEVIKESRQLDLGAEDAVSLVGDFNGDGRDEVAIYVAGQWFVDLNGNGVWDAGDLWIRLGTKMDLPVVGDWDGDGKDDIGIYGRKWERDLRRIKTDAGLPDPSNRSRQYLESRKTLGMVSKHIKGHDRARLMRQGDDGPLRADAVDHVFHFGEEVDTPISGDWNGDGIDQIGTFRAGVWVLDSEGDGRRKEGETQFEFGKPGDQPIVGDFDGDGIDEVGVIRGNVWIIDSDGDRKLTEADERIELTAQPDDSQPVAGDWNGDGRDTPGYYRKSG